VFGIFFFGRAHYLAVAKENTMSGTSKFKLALNFAANRENLQLYHTTAKYLIAAYIMGVCNELSDLRGTLLSNRNKTLPDLGFDILPYSPSVVWLCDPLNKLALALVLARILRSQNKKLLACIFMDAHITMMLLRGVCLPWTTFPAAFPECYNRLTAKPDNIFIEPIKRMFRADGLSSWCHDLLFSGHAVVFVLVAMFLHDSGGAIWWRLIGWVGGLFGCLLLTITRQHYSIDIIVAIIITYLVYLQWRKEVIRLFQPV